MALRGMLRCKVSVWPDSFETRREGTRSPYAKGGRTRRFLPGSSQCYDWLVFIFQMGLHAADIESQRSMTLNPSFAEGYRMRAYVLIALNRREDAIEAQQRPDDVVRLHEVQSGKRNADRHCPTFFRDSSSDVHTPSQPESPRHSSLSRRLMTKERGFGFGSRSRSSHRAMYSFQERGAKPTSSSYAGLRVKPLDDFIELAEGS